MVDNIELVQIEAGEDTHSVRDRLSFLRGQRVLLVWPEEGTALTRRLDLVLVQREAMRRAIQLAIVTHDVEVIHHAKDLNISTFETISASKRARWKRGRSKVFTSRRQRPKDSPNPEDLMPLASRIRIKRPTLGRLQSLALRLGILTALFGVVMGVAYVVVPSATVTLAVAEQIIAAELQITVNTDPDFDEIDVENAVLPALRLEIGVEDTATVNTTGTLDLGNERAVGTVVFINQTDETVVIPSGTTVSTSAGTPIMFRTTNSAVLPAENGSQTEAPIEAISGFEGAIGNVEANLINTIVGPLENSVSVLNLSPTTGGVSRVENIVTEDDYELVRAYAIQQLQERAYTGMLDAPEMSDTHFIILESLNIPEIRDDQTTYSADVDDLADTLSVTIRATVEALAVDERLGQQIVFARMNQQIPRGRVIQPETIEYQRGPVTINGDGTITFTMRGRGIVAGQISEGVLQNQLAGLSRNEALAYLLERVDIAEGTTPQIRITPELFGQLPILPLRINIIVQDTLS